MNYDIDAIRDQFPSLSIQDEGVARVYFDNPAGTQVPRSVADRMSACLIETNANIGGGFETSDRVDALVADAHQAMADFLNAASPDEIIIGQNMTTLTLHISRSIGRTLRPGDEIIVTRMDHDANIAPWLLLAEDLNLNVKWLPFNRETFEFDLDELDKLLSERTRLVCFAAASNLLGTINDVKTICAKAKAAGAWTYIDAVQFAPHVAIDVQDIGCDFLACSAYKFFGPHLGMLWGRREVLESLHPYKVRPASEAIPGCFETGTQNHEGMVGMAAAVDYFAWVGETFAQNFQGAYEQFQGRRLLTRAGLDYLFAYEKQLAGHLIDGLQSLSGVKVQGITSKDALDCRVPTVAFTAEGATPASIAGMLAKQNIFVWNGHNYAVEVAKTLGVYETGGVVRIGPVHYNTIDEIDRLLLALDEILPKARAA